MAQSWIIGQIIGLKRISLLILGSVLSVVTVAQNAIQPFDFIEHLNEVQAYNEGVLFIDQQLTSAQQPFRLDSLNYHKGLFQYRLKDLAGSIATFSKVRDSNIQIFQHAKFLQAFQLAYVDKLNDSQLVLEGMQPNSDVSGALKDHLLAGNALLRRDLEQFEELNSGFNRQFYQLSPYQDQMLKNYEGLKQMKKKSGAMAGVLSGLVPGAGKFYLGKIGEGYTTLLVSSLLAFAARESYRKDGANSTRFGIYAGLFSAVYIANIWGSVLSVKIYKDDFNRTFDEAILLNMHVPIRTLFD